MLRTHCFLGFQTVTTERLRFLILLPDRKHQVCSHPDIFQLLQFQPLGCFHVWFLLCRPGNTPGRCQGSNTTQFVLALLPLWLSLRGCWDSRQSWNQEPSVQCCRVWCFQNSYRHVWHRYVIWLKNAIPLQSPIFGYLWGTSIPWFRAPRGYPFCGGKWAPYQYHHTMEWKTHTIPHSYQYHVTYHTIPYHTIPFDLIPYHQGCLGSFHQIWKVFLQAAILVRWAPSFVDRFFRFLLSF